MLTGGRFTLKLRVSSRQPSMLWCRLPRRLEVVSAMFITSRCWGCCPRKTAGVMQVVGLPGGETVPGFIAKYQKSGLIEFAEPDYLGIHQHHFGSRHVYRAAAEP
jgi:hypothetical protein